MATSPKIPEWAKEFPEASPEVPDRSSALWEKAAASLEEATEFLEVSPNVFERAPEAAAVKYEQAAHMAKSIEKTINNPAASANHRLDGDMLFW